MTEARQAKPNARGSDRRGQILEAASKLFAERGIHPSRIDDVAASAGVAKGTVYWHFSSKDDIVLTLIESFFGEVHAGLLELRDAPGTAQERLEDYLLSYAALLEEQKHLAPLTVEFFALSPRQPRIREFLTTCYAQWATAIAELLEQGDARGELVAADPLTTARSLIELIDGVVLNWTILAQKPDLGERMQAAFTVFARGLSARTE